MKKFFAEHSYNMVKMFLNQFAISIFGVGLAFASALADNKALTNATGIGAILFYLFLLYTMTWEIGYRDRDSGRGGSMWKGALISLCANIPNFIFAIFITLAILVHSSVISSIGAVCQFLSMALEGMYTGILSNHVGGVPLNTYWVVYFLIPLPAIITCGVAYLLGRKDVKFTSLFDPVLPESDRDPGQKKGRKHRD